MNKKFLGLSLAVAVFFVLACDQNAGQAQILVPRGISMFGTFEKGGVMSGFFGKNQIAAQNKTWGVFIGANGKIYKFVLIDKNVRELYIDGQKIADADISKHAAEYESFVARFRRGEEIESESREIERKIKPLDREMENISQEVEKLDRDEEKAERRADKKSSSFVEDKRKINAQQEKLSVIEKELSDQLEELSKQQEKLSSEHESLNLLSDLNEVLLRIGDDLKSAGVVKNTKGLSFKLSNVELIVNGKKVSPEIFEALKPKYIIETGGETGFVFNWKGEV